MIIYKYCENTTGPKRRCDCYDEQKHHSWCWSTFTSVLAAEWMRLSVYCPSLCACSSFTSVSTSLCVCTICCKSPFAISFHSLLCVTSKFICSTLEAAERQLLVRLLPYAWLVLTTRLAIILYVHGHYHLNSKRPHHELLWLSSSSKSWCMNHCIGFGWPTFLWTKRWWFWLDWVMITDIISTF